MSKSISYYLTLMVILYKGIKKSFSQDPIDYLTLRKSDISVPKSKYFTSKNTCTLIIGESEVTEVKNESHVEKLLIFIHGGAFVSGPSQHHWDTVERISKETKFSIWLCNYPKAPESKISKISNNIDLVYESARKKFDSDSIIMLGDSVGGTLIITLIQRLIRRRQSLPSKLILISPVMDASLDNPQIEALDKQDPMLSRNGVLSAKRLCLEEDGDLKNEAISPLFGIFQGFPNTALFLADRDITYPDQVLFYQELKKDKLPYSVFLGEGMPHIWPLLPIMKESKIALNSIISILNRST